MAKKENKFKGYDISTQAVHTGAGYDAETGAVRRPLHMANSYKLPDDLSKVNYSSTDLLMYARNGNPNQHWLEEKVAALHGADDAIVLEAASPPFTPCSGPCSRRATASSIRKSVIWQSIACSTNYSTRNSASKRSWSI